MASNHELTWRKDGRWCKVIDGRRYYFSKPSEVRGKSDRRGYKVALERYRKFLAARSQQADLVHVLRKDESRLPLLALMAEEEGRSISDDADLLWLYEESMARADKLREEFEQRRTKRRAATDNGGTSAPDLIRAYVADQERRHKITMTQPDALPRKKRLSVTSFKTLNDVIKPLQRWIAEHARVTTFGDEAQTERLFLSYRKWLDDQMIAGRIAKQTVSNRARALRPLIMWLWKERHIDNIPRNLADICQQYGTEQKAKALPISTIHRIWAVADDRMRCFMCLALNCALYTSELATIKVGDVKNGYLAKRRKKTGVPYKIKLWPTTFELIRRHKHGTAANDLLFTTERGFPLVHECSTSKADSIAQAFGKLKKKHKIRATWSQFRDTTATAIESIGKRIADPTLVSQMLAHADGRTARFYIDRGIEPIELETSNLDKAIDELEEYYGLKLDRD